MNTHEELGRVVKGTACKPAWSFSLERTEDRVAIRLVISVTGPNSRGDVVECSHCGGVVPTLTVRHYFPVPEAEYNEKTWTRWIFECCRRVENHELGEWFRVGDERPFAPLHGPGEDPYTVHEFRDVVDARTNQDGTVNER